MFKIKKLSYEFGRCNKMPLGVLWKIAGGAGTRGYLGSKAMVFCSNYGQKADWKDGFDSRGVEALRVG